MGTADFLRAVLAVAIGLLLGSVLPADLIARRRGIDIRATGDGNPGTVNAFRVLGVRPGVMTLLYDGLVGVATIAIAAALGTSSGVGYLAGLVAFVGHRFPVYLGFRGGGQGMAACAGMVLYGVGIALSRGWLMWWDVLGLLAIGGLTFAVTRSDRWIALTLLPALLLLLALARPGWEYLVFMAVVCANIVVVQAGFVRRSGAADPPADR